MKNNKFLKVLLSLIALSFIGISNNAHAYLKCTPLNSQGLQQCEAGIDYQVADAVAASVGGQQLTQWCWAASIEMVFRYYGFDVPQAYIVQETWGNIVNLPAHPHEILANLNRSWWDSSDRYFAVSGNAVIGNISTTHFATAAQDLANNMPLIIGTSNSISGHAMVLIALQYTRDQWGRGKVESAIVSDPWPGRGRRRLSAQEWSEVSFLAQIRVAEDFTAHNRHPLADLVFNSIERRYGNFFPNTYKTEEFEYNGNIIYWRLYANGAGLAKWRGNLLYRIPGREWTHWDALVKWPL